MSDDHSRLIRLEEAKKAFSHELEAVKDAASRRESKLDKIQQEIERSRMYRETMCKDCMARINDLELRVRSLENAKYYMLGATGVVTFISSIAAQFILR